MFNYNLKCDSLRFVLIYNMDKPKPELFRFRHRTTRSRKSNDTISGKTTKKQMINKLFPSENIVYKTPITIESALSKLSENVGTEKEFIAGYFKNTFGKQYVGKIFRNKFDIKRAIRNRNSFLPQIKGEVYDENYTTKIKIELALPKTVIIFMLIWLGGMFFGGILMLSVLNSEKFGLFNILPFVMIAFGIFIPRIVFKNESKKSKNDLLRIFEAEIEQ